MGKVIILTGAPDAASLDWTTVEPATETETIWQWQGSSSSTETSALDHPQWRVVPIGATGREAPAERPDTQLAADSVQAGLATEQLEPVITSHPLYARAEFLALTPATQESTQKSTQDETQQAGSLALSSLDEASLSLCLPNALPQLSPQLPPWPPPAMYFTTSQEFLEHSLAVHEALPSSLPTFDLPPVYETSASFDETTMSLSQSVSLSFSAAPRPPLPADVPRWQPLTHVADIPSAPYLLSVAPQTVTANLVVAIVSVGVPRVVGHSNSNQNNGRRRDRPPASLVELVVGDETRSGFGLTIWMDAAEKSASSLATLLPTLAPHDVVLLRHVALHVFGDKVYGSSLRKDQTKMHILHRGGQSGQRREPAGDDALFSAVHLAAVATKVNPGTQASAAYPVELHLLAKTARVRNWALRYVIVDGVGVSDVCGDGNESLEKDHDSGPRVQARQMWMMPPADTQ